MSSDEDKLLDEAYAHAMKLFCQKRGYDSEVYPGTNQIVCKHTQKTCERDHGDAKLMRPELQGTELDYIYGEWNPTTSKCMASDGNFKNWCLDMGLTYHQDPYNGVGYCTPNTGYCTKYATSYSPYGPVDITKGWEPHTFDKRTDKRLIGQELNQKIPEIFEQDPKLSFGDCYVHPGQWYCENVTIWGTTLCREGAKIGKDAVATLAGQGYEKPFEGWKNVEQRRPGETDFIWLNRINRELTHGPFKFDKGFTPELREEHYHTTINGQPRVVVLTKVNKGINKDKLVDYRIQ